MRFFHQRGIAHLCIVALLGMLVYAGSLPVPFQFDDVPNIVDNPIIKDFEYVAYPDRASAFARYDALRTRYVGYATFALNYRLHELDVRGYHIVNLVIHILNAWLVYWLVALSFQTPVLRASRLFEGRQWAALLAAALFVAHPVQTQAVTYIVQRLASLAALFYLSSMTCYIKARLSRERASRWGYYLLCLTLTVFAMKTKETAFTLPVAIGLYEAFFFRGNRRTRALWVLPLLCTMAIIPLTLVDIGKPVSEVMESIAQKTTVLEMGRGAYFLTELRVMVTYLRLLLLPINQTLDYDYPTYASLARVPVVLSIMLITGLLAFAVHLYRRKEPAARLASFGIVFFFLAIAVESTVVVLYPIYEHRVYMPSVGMVMAASVGASWLVSSARIRGGRVAIVAVSATVVAVLGMMAFERNTLWRDELTLWQDTMGKAPGNVRVLNNVAAFYLAMGRFEEAEERLALAGRIRPDYPETYNNLGLLYQKQGRYEQALEQYRKALRLRPVFPEALNFMGICFDKTGQYNKALEYYDLALQIWPDYDDAYINLGASLGLQGRYQEARQTLKRALALNPDAPDAYNNLGNVHFQLQEYETAEGYYRRALALAPGEVSARANLIKIYIMTERYGKARTELEELEGLAPELAHEFRAELRRREEGR